MSMLGAEHTIPDDHTDGVNVVLALENATWLTDFQVVFSLASSLERYAERSPTEVDMAQVDYVAQCLRQLESNVRNVAEIRRLLQGVGFEDQEHREAEKVRFLVGRAACVCACVRSRVIYSSLSSSNPQPCPITTHPRSHAKWHLNSRWTTPRRAR